MTHDVEDALRRNLRTRADQVGPAPRDLVTTTRTRYRARARRRVATAAVGLAVLGVAAVGVPAAQRELDDRTAQQQAAGTLTASLYDLPVRGDLADDTAWLDAVAARPWVRVYAEYSSVQPVDDLSAIDVASHRVVWAGSSGTGRAALVLGIEGAQLAATWFTGPADAAPGDLVQVTDPGRTYPDQPHALLDADGSLVVVTRPGDGATWSAGIVVDADGVVGQSARELTVRDGVAVTEVELPVTPSSAQLTVQRDRRTVYRMTPQLTTAAQAARPQLTVLQDPRGVDTAADPEWTRSAGATLLGDHAGSVTAGTEVVLLGAGPLGTGDGARFVTVGATLTSGATVTCVIAYRVDAQGRGTGSTVVTDPAPAGIALVDRLVAVPLEGALVVTGPTTGTSVEVLDAAGAVVARLPVARGGAAGPVPDTAWSVRLLDAAGVTVADAPLSR